MAVNTWKLLAAAGALTLAAGGGCGGDSGGGGGGEDTENSTGNVNTPSQTAKLGAGVAGKACGSASDCDGDGASCKETIGGILGLNPSPAPGGYCTGACLTDEDCGDNGACISAFADLAVMGECQQKCDANDDCRDGYECLDLSVFTEAANVPTTCLPALDTETLGDGVVGKECSENAECAPGTCNNPGVLFDPEATGFCTGSCFEDASCGEGGVCVGAFKSQLFSTPGGCWRSCTADDDCIAPDHVCRASGASLGVMACQPPPFMLPDGGLGALFPDAGLPGSGGDTTGGDTTDLDAGAGE